ncbi:hypothetical protein BDN70DRAFT_823189 [Pholiota conissans]|uniref:Uncharacterized protein n=1 Tax=Pholiota conissans TaxID=109636 RepID=A0A9P6D6S0_9AGAR|nr:hypothetical protein BDN70DRAFT_823189 [Pholiota conissans]
MPLFVYFLSNSFSSFSLELEILRTIIHFLFSISVMSRGDRVTVSGNLSTSMRDNYGEHGVVEYYKKVGSSYRNPHYPGIRSSLFTWFNRWWDNEKETISRITPEQIMLFDMACASGEATLAFFDWCNSGKKMFQESSKAQGGDRPPVARPHKKGVIISIPLGPEFPKPQVAAADPFTAAAYQERTSYHCSALSFEAIAEGAVPSTSVNIVDGSICDVLQTGDAPEDTERPYPYLVEVVVCSFALHLVENPSALFALLWQLSLKARWLVILAPHKKPEIKDGWGWCKWDVDAWAECSMTSTVGELLYDRVHCRAYRSVNI